MLFSILSTFVAILQPEVWEELSGDTIAGTWGAITGDLSTPVRIDERSQRLVVLAYEECKARIQRRQGGIP